MKEYISNRLLALLGMLTLVGAILLLARWGMLTGETVAALLGGLVTSVRDLIKKEADCTTGGTGPGTVAAGAGTAAVLFALLSSCGTVPTARIVGVSAETCAALARDYGRDDLVVACETAQDLAPVLDQLLRETGTCAARPAASEQASP